MTNTIIGYFLLLFASGFVLKAQDLPPMQLDRPDQTECVFITPKFYLQAENGFSLEKNEEAEINLFYPSTLWKIGINPNLEVRLITEILSSKNNITRLTGLNPLVFGFKVKLAEENGFFPATSLIGQYSSAKIGKSEYHKVNSTPSFRFIFQNTLNDRFTLGYNLGVEWEEVHLRPDFIYTISLGTALNEKFGAYAEVYGFINSKERQSHYVDGGFTFMVNNDFILDFSGSTHISNAYRDGYVSLGISYRLNLCNN